MNLETPLCPRCGQPYPLGAAICPECGLDLVPRRARIRCQSCGRRILEDAAVCPRCGQDPRAPAAPRSRRTPLFLAGTILALCLAVVLYRSVATDYLRSSIPVADTPTPKVEVVLIVATLFPPSPTPLPTATFTATVTATTTPTRRNGATETPMPLTATPTLPPYSAPQLAAPQDGAVFEGPDADVTLEWQPVSSESLRENEWYAIALSFTARDGSTLTRTSWSKEPRWHVTPAWWNDLSGQVRSVSWTITVMRVDGVDPFASLVRVVASPSSARRSFVWK